MQRQRLATQRPSHHSHQQYYADTGARVGTRVPIIVLCMYMLVLMSHAKPDRVAL